MDMANYHIIIKFLVTIQKYLRVKIKHPNSLLNYGTWKERHFVVTFKWKKKKKFSPLGSEKKEHETKRWTACHDTTAKPRGKGSAYACMYKDIAMGIYFSREKNK